MTVLVTGVNGKIGAGVAGALVERGVEVRGGSSHAASAAGRKYPVEEVDLSRPATLWKALDGVEAVFLYPNTEALDGVIDELRQAGVLRVVLLSSSSVLLPAAGTIAEHHRQAEEPLLASGLPLTILRPDVFATNSLDWADQVRHGEVALPYPNAHVAPVHEADVVDAAVATLLEPDHLGRAYALTGPGSMTQAEQIQTIANALGSPARLRGPSLLGRPSRLACSPDLPAVHHSPTWHRQCEPRSWRGGIDGW